MASKYKKAAQSSSYFHSLKYALRSISRDWGIYFTIIMVIAVIGGLGLGSSYFLLAQQQTTERVLRSKANEIEVRCQDGNEDNDKHLIGRDRIKAFKGHPRVVTAYQDIRSYISISHDKYTLETLRVESTVAKHPIITKDTLYVGEGLSSNDSDEIILSKGALKKLLKKNRLSVASAKKYLHKDITVIATRKTDGKYQSIKQKHKLVGILNDEIELALLSTEKMVFFEMWRMHAIHMDKRQVDNTTNLKSISICLDGGLSADRYKAFEKNFELTTLEGVKEKTMINQQILCYDVVRDDGSYFKEETFGFIRNDPSVFKVFPVMKFSANFTEHKKELRVEAAYANTILDNTEKTEAIDLLQKRWDDEIILPLSLFAEEKEFDPAMKINTPIKLQFEKSDGKIMVTFNIADIKDIENPLISTVTASNIAKWYKGVLDFDLESQEFHKAEAKKAPEFKYPKAKVFVTDISYIESVSKHIESMNYIVSDSKEIINKENAILKTGAVSIILVFSALMICGGMVFFGLMSLNTERYLNEFVSMINIGATEKFIGRIFSAIAFIVTMLSFLIAFAISVATIFLTHEGLARFLDVEMIRLDIFSIDIVIVLFGVFLLMYTFSKLACSASFRKIKKINLSEALKNF